MSHGPRSEVPVSCGWLDWVKDLSASKRMEKAKIAAANKQMWNDVICFERWREIIEASKTRDIMDDLNLYKERVIHNWETFSDGGEEIDTVYHTLYVWSISLESACDRLSGNDEEKWEHIVKEMKSMERDSELDTEMRRQIEQMRADLVTLVNQAAEQKASASELEPGSSADKKRVLFNVTNHRFYMRDVTDQQFHNFVNALKSVIPSAYMLQTYNNGEFAIVRKSAAPGVSVWNDEQKMRFVSAFTEAVLKQIIDKEAYVIDNSIYDYA